MCQTATYYEDIQICSLYNEKSDIGQILSVANQTNSVLAIINREPRICVVSSQSSWIQSAITIAGNSSGSSGSSLSQLNSPISMYYDEANNQIIIGDHGNLRVIQFSLNNRSSPGTVIAGGNGGGCGLNQFSTVVGLAVDSSRQLYVADSACAQIIRFPSNSNSSTFGVRIGYFNGPQGMFVNPLTDDLYVAILGDYSVLKFSKNSTNGVVVVGNNGVGNGLNQLNTPNSVYFDYLYTNSLYVVDTGNNRVLKFPSNSTNATYGTIVAGSGSAGSGSNQLNIPRYVVVDRNGIVYVSDGNNNRIERWLPNATSGDTVAGGTLGVAANQLFFPETVIIDKNYNLLVADRMNSRIQLFNITVC